MATTPQQQSESVEFVKQFTRVGVEMAEFSLSDLEGRMSSELNQNKIDNLTDSEWRQIDAIATKFGPLLSEDPAIEALVLSDFKNNFRFVAEFFNDPLKTEIINFANGVDAAKFAEIKDNFKTSAAHVRAQRLRAAQEHLTFIPDRLNNEQRNLLRNVPDIGSVVSQVEREMQATNQTMESAAATERLIQVVTEKAYAEVQRVFDNNIQMVTQIKNQQQQEVLNERINEQLGVRVEGALGANNLMEHGGNAFRALFGMGGYEDVNSNPLITAVLNPEKRAELNEKLVLAASVDGHGANIPDDIRGLVEGEVRRIMTGKTAADVAVHFHKMHTEVGSADPEVVARHREIMVAKLKTVPKEWQKTPEAQKYEDYVLENGVDSYDFNGAMERGYLGEISFLRKMIMMFKSLWNSVKGAFSGEEDLEQWDRIKHYKDTVEEDPPPADPELLGSGRGIFARLLALTEAAHGPDSFNITRNGQKLDINDIQSTRDIEMIETISNKLSFEQNPDRLNLLTKGIDIEVLESLALNEGDQRGDTGYNVDFYEGGFKINFDLENYGWGGYIDEVLGAVGGVPLGLWFVSNPAGWITFLAAVGIYAAGGAFGANLLNLDEFIEGGGQNFDYDTLTPEKLRAAIEEIEAKVGLIEEAFKNVNPEQLGQYIGDFSSKEHRLDFDNITDIAPLFDNTGISPAFDSVLALDDSFWGGYKMTQEDINNFAAELDNGLFDFWKKDLDNEEDAVFQNNGGGYTIAGSGGTLLLGWGRVGVNNAQEFFDWLRKEQA